MTGFLLTAVGISLFGVMAPGPITAATLAAGMRSRHAGAWICGGHIAVELPLMLVFAGGLGEHFKSPGLRAGVGLAGGAVLVLVGLQLLVSLPAAAAQPTGAAQRHPLWTGIVLSAANP